MQTKLSYVWTYEALQACGGRGGPFLAFGLHLFPFFSPLLLLSFPLRRLIGWGEINKGTIQLQQEAGGTAFVVPAAGST